MGTIKTFFLISLLLHLFFMVVPKGAYAIHKGAGAMECNACHIMGRGAPTALINGNIDDLCFDCHAAGGSRANVPFGPAGVIAPKVGGRGYRRSSGERWSG